MNLRIIATIALASGLTACAALGGGAGGSGFADIIKTIATDPRCGHEDSIQFVAGVLSGSAARHCPIPNGTAPAPAPVAASGAPAAVPPSDPSPA
jgi:hypothetical protein